MTFFYDLNKRLASIAGTQLNEDKAKPDFLDVDKDHNKKETFKQAVKDKEQEVAEASTGDYSAKKAAAGKDIGKPGKAFSKIVKTAGAKYGSKAAGERVAGAVLNKLRHPKESIGQVKEAYNPVKAVKQCAKSYMEMNGIRSVHDLEAEDIESIGGDCQMNYQDVCEILGCNLPDSLGPVKSYDEHGDMEEGNAFTAALKATPKGGKFKVGNKEFTDTSDLEEGFKEMDAWLASREKEKGTGRFDKRKVSTGTVYTRKPETFDDPETDPEATGGAPKRRGRPKGKDKGPERVTAKSYKYKAGRPQKTAEDLDSDGVMMTRPTNCSSESIEPGERAEYNDEAGMTKDSLHTIVRSAKELERALRTNENLPEWVQEKIGQIKGMMSSVTDYMLSTHERDADVAMEKAPPGAKAERMVKGIKKSLSKDGKLSAKDKAIAYATTWKAKKAGKVEEESTDKEDTRAERAGRKVAKDIEYDEGHKGKDDAKAEKAGKKVTKDIEYDDKKDKKEKKVDETTVAGSVATSAPAGKKSSGSMQFGKGVYEGFNNSVEKMINESIEVADTIAENQGKTITVTASGPEADMLMQLLKAAGLSGQSSGCGCGQTPCACDQTVDEAYGDTDETLNNPDWPTDKETLDAEPNLRTYSGGLNGPKSTGQTTIPVIASQERRLHSESVELERNLFKTWKNYKG